MNRRLIRSDKFVILSDDDPEPFRICLAQTPSPTCARFATDRTGAARHIGRDLQALRSTELPLRRRTGTRPEAVSVHQPARRATATRLHDAHLQVARLIDNFRKLRATLDEICAINTELLRRREDLG